MKNLERNRLTILEELRAIPERIGRVFESQQEAAHWTLLLTVAGYPVKRRGKSVWFSSANLQETAVAKAMDFGFEAIHGAA